MHGLIKKVSKKALLTYRNFALSRTFNKEIKEHINDSSEPIISALSPAQEKDIKEYWDQFGISIKSTEWHRYYYSKTGILNPRFVPDNVFHQLIRPRMNDIHLAVAWSDKSFTDHVVHDVKTVKSVLRCVNGRLLDEDFRLLDPKTANANLNKYEQLVIKPTMLTDTGKNVTLQSAPFDVLAIAKKYGKNYVVQLPFKQHNELAALNESSVNTVRINTVLFDDKAHATSAFIKVGQPGEFTDNGGGKNRIFIGISDGKYSDFAYDHDCNKFYSIPTGQLFANKPVPYYREMCRAVEKAHSYIPHFGLAFWDVSADEYGEPTIIEMNLRYPDTYVPQVGSGPFFGEYTDDLLKYLRKE